jgi:hypothetical protein
LQIHEPEEWVLKKSGKEQEQVNMVAADTVAESKS